MRDGRPLKFTLEELESLIDQYFESCRVKRKNASGVDLTDEEMAAWDFTDDYHPTICGLAVALDTTRSLLCNYERKADFYDTIKRAKTKIEAYSSQKLYNNQVTGVIFGLKCNFGWNEKPGQEDRDDLAAALLELTKKLPD